MQITRAILLALLTIGISAATTESVSARRGGGFSSSRSFSSRRPTPSRSSSWSKTRTSPSVNRVPQSRPKQSEADRRVNAKTPTYRSKDEATKAFVSQYKGTYTQKPTPGSPPPAKRPDYIPRSTTVEGKTYNVTYNMNQGGYGYWNGGGPGIGTWIMYDALSDAAMTSALMTRHDVYYGAATDTPAFYRRSSFNASMMIIGLLIVVIIFTWGFWSYA